MSLGRDNGYAKTDFNFATAQSVIRGVEWWRNRWPGDAFLVHCLGVAAVPSWSASSS